MEKGKGDFHLPETMKYLEEEKRVAGFRNNKHRGKYKLVKKEVKES